MTSAGRDGLVDANGLRFHYLEWGRPRAPALLLLHGFGNQAHMWDGFAPIVAAHYRVVALDSRGHGDSDHAEDYGDELNVADTLGVVEALGLTSMDLVGFSMGGAQAMAIAGRRPDMVRRLVIVDRGWPSAAGQQGRERIARVVSRARDTFPDAPQALAYIRSANPRWPEDRVQGALLHAFRAQPDGSYALKYDRRLRERFAAGGLRGLDIEACWRALRCPVLLIRGAESDVLPAAVAEQMVVELPHAQLHVVSGAGHNVPVDNPAGFNAAARAFLIEAAPD